MKVCQAFAEQGYCVLRNALSAADIIAFKNSFAKIYGAHYANLERFAIADFVNKYEVAYRLPTNDSVLSSVRSIIGGDFAWLPQADMHRNICTAMHRDNPCRDEAFTGEDWNEETDEYRIVRVAVYLTSSSDSGSQFIVSPGSHTRPGKGYDLLDLAVGDLLIFDPRIYHGSTGARAIKDAIYLCFGVRNMHSRRLVEWFYTARKNDLGYSALNPDLRKIIAHKGLLLY
jgi:ectoine hydroxylase-related dioxygenase (phytanoyl-CoA dioxygenase family)